MVTVIGDRDARAADLAARRILREASAVLPERKLFVRVLSDDHGFPSLTATLSSPAGVDAAFDGGAIKAPPEPPRDPKQPQTPFRWSADMSLTGEQTTLVAQLNNARTDSLDYLAFWKTFDLAASSRLRRYRRDCLKNNPRLSDMERWADGWPVKRLFFETLRPLSAAPRRGERRAPLLPVSPSDAGPDDARLRGLTSMKLFHSPTSPFARKVMVVAHELGLAERIELLPTRRPPGEARRQHPARIRWRRCRP